MLGRDVADFAIETHHIGLQLHHEAVAVDPVQARAPVEIGLPVIVDKGLGIDHMKAGAETRDQRLAAIGIAPRPGGMIGGANPDLIADRDIHPEMPVSPRTTEGAQTPDLPEVGLVAAAWWASWVWRRSSRGNCASATGRVPSPHGSMVA
jgi:hypothetical protein